ncbi:hypothetical protein [Nocardiopsis sp. NPDC057823]|uniref:hypothetical protein n=1 Tax=Nocardiopsis sp. NPDC057823 TaxID=3346256 RepID=UPI00367074DC
MASQEFEVAAGKELKRVVDAMRKVDSKAPAKIRSKMRAVARQGAKVVKPKARNLPSKGVKGGTTKRPHKRKQTRRAIAAGVKVQASTGGRKGVGLRIVTSMPTRAQAFLPRAFDVVDEWSHPVFKTKEFPNRTAKQRGGFDWFVRPLGEMRPEFQAGMTQILDEAREEIRRAGG